MATKFVSADLILKKKGIKRREFDTDAFCAVVGKFFEEHEPSETIRLSPLRFAAMENPPEGDFIDYLDTSIWEKRVEDPNDPFDFFDYLYKQRAGEIVPTLYINEPFFNVAAHFLQVLCGFDVKKRTRKKKRECIVSLPI